jgi:hypothetical protein
MWFFVCIFWISENLSRVVVCIVFWPSYCVYVFNFPSIQFFNGCSTCRHLYEMDHKPNHLNRSPCFWMSNPTYLGQRPRCEYMESFLGDKGCLCWCGWDCEKVMFTSFIVYSYRIKIKVSCATTHGWVTIYLSVQLFICIRNLSIFSNAIKIYTFPPTKSHLKTFELHNFLCVKIFKHSNYMTCDISVPTLGSNIWKLLVFYEKKSYFMGI